MFEMVVAQVERPGNSCLYALLGITVTPQRPRRNPRISRVTWGQTRAVTQPGSSRQDSPQSWIRPSGGPALDLESCLGGDQLARVVGIQVLFLDE